MPKRVVVAWLNAARTTSREVGAGMALRWKYHCDTVAAVVERWIPLIMERVQIYMRTKYTANHQLVASMIKFLTEDEIWPPRNTLVNIPSHIQVHATTVASVMNPNPRSPGLEAKILEANSKMPMALFNE